MYCRYCGNELNEKAVICPKCGCGVEVRNERKPLKIPPINWNLVYVILKYLSVALVCITITFLIVAIFKCYIDTDVTVYIESLKEGTTSSYETSRFYLNESLTVTSFVLSLVSYVSSSMLFVLGFKKENRQSRFFGDSLFIINNSLLILCIIAMMYI